MEQGKQSSQQGKAAAEQQGKQGNHQQGSRASRAARQQSKPPGAKSIKKAELQQHVKLIAVSSVGKSSDFLSKSDWRIKLIPCSLFSFVPAKAMIEQNIWSFFPFPLLTNNTFQKSR